MLSLVVVFLKKKTLFVCLLLLFLFIFFLECFHLPQGVLPYMSYIGMCRCEGYGFQAVYSSIGYINQSVWV